MRRAGNWHSDLPIEASALTNRGFTGHEHVDEVGIIHMNGRIYDPELGRFLSADPHIQSPNNSQSHNRYSYVLNNPLKYTDPSGYFIEWMMRGVVKFMGRYGRVVFAVVAAYMTGGMTMAAFGYGFAGFGAAMGGGAYGVMAVTAAGAVGGFASGYVTSGTMQGAFRGAAAGAFSALLASAIGNVFADGAMDKAFGGTVGAEIARNTLHGISQGTITAASGGDFKSGFIGAFVGHAVGAGVMSKISGSGPGSILARTMVAATAGGLASKWGGGKFANGAVSAAFVHLFNSEFTMSQRDPENVSMDGIKLKPLIVRLSASGEFPYGIPLHNGEYRASGGALGLGWHETADGNIDSPVAGASPIFNQGHGLYASGTVDLISGDSTSKLYEVGAFFGLGMKLYADDSGLRGVGFGVGIGYNFLKLKTKLGQGWGGGYQPF
jgi:RHS repeat-associated protein